MLVRFNRFVGCLLALLCATTLAISAGTASLTWDSISQPQLAGYRLYYGTTAGAYTQNVNAGLSTESTVSGLNNCTTYHFAVKAYDSTGLETPTYSNQVSGWPRPTIGTVSPAQLQRGTQTSLMLGGTNFQSGATVSFTDPAIHVTGVTINNCSQLTVNVNVGANAALGAGTVRVINSDQVFGSATGVFTVGTDSTAPAITGVEAGAVGSTTATISWTTNESSNSQVFYRLQEGQTSYQTTTIDPDMTREHVVTLTGLTPEKTYQYYVRSADAAGNATTSTPVRTFETRDSSFTYIRFEAEAGMLNGPITRTSAAGGFRGGWLSLPAGTPTGYPNAPAGSARFGFNLPSSGNWFFWIRMYGTSTGSDGWLEEVDGAGLAYVLPSNHEVWEWTASRSYTLHEGLHELRLGGHEAQARVDRILITDDPNFIPTEQPGDDVTPPAAVDGAHAVAANQTVQLSWNDPADLDAVTLVIRYRTDGAIPVSPVDGLPLVEEPVVQGSPGTFDHTELRAGETYRYSIFTVDAAGNVSDRVSVEARAAGTSVRPTKGRATR